MKPRRFLLPVGLLAVLLHATVGIADDGSNLEARYVRLGDLAQTTGEAAQNLVVKPEVVGTMVSDVFGKGVEGVKYANSADKIWSALQSGNEVEFWETTLDEVREYAVDGMNKAILEAEEKAAQEAVRAMGQRAATTTETRVFRYLPLRSLAAGVKAYNFCNGVMFWIEAAQLVADYAGQRFDNHMLQRFVRDYCLLRSDNPGLASWSDVRNLGLLTRGEPQTLEALRRAQGIPQLTVEDLYRAADQRYAMMLAKNRETAETIHQLCLRMRTLMQSRLDHQLQRGIIQAEADLEPLRYLIDYAPLEATRARRELATSFALGHSANYQGYLTYYRGRNGELKLESEQAEKDKAATRALVYSVFEQVREARADPVGRRRRPELEPTDRYRADGEYPPYLGIAIWPNRELVTTGALAQYYALSLKKVWLETVHKPPTQTLQLGRAELDVRNYLQEIRDFKYMAYQILSDAYTLASLYAGPKHYHLVGRRPASADYLIEVVDIPIFFVRCPDHNPEGGLTRGEMGAEVAPCCSRASITQVASVREEHWGTRFWWEPLDFDWWPYNYRSEAEAVTHRYFRSVSADRLYGLAQLSHRGYLLNDPPRPSRAPLHPSESFAQFEVAEAREEVTREDALRLIFQPVVNQYLACLTDLKQRYRNQDDALAQIIASLKTWRQANRGAVSSRFDKFFVHGSGVRGLTDYGISPLAAIIQMHGHGNLGSQARHELMAGMAAENQDRQRIQGQLHQALRDRLDREDAARRVEILRRNQQQLDQWDREVREGLPTEKAVREQEERVRQARAEISRLMGNSARYSPSPVGYAASNRQIFNELPGDEAAKVVFADEMARTTMVAGGYSFDYGAAVGAGETYKQAEELTAIERDVAEISYEATMLNRLGDLYQTASAAAGNLQGEYELMLRNRGQVLAAYRKWLREQYPAVLAAGERSRAAAPVKDAADRVLGAVAGPLGLNLAVAPPYSALLVQESRFDPRRLDPEAAAALDPLMRAYRAAADARGGEIAAYSGPMAAARAGFELLGTLDALYRPTGPDLVELLRELQLTGFSVGNDYSLDRFNADVRARFRAVVLTADDVQALDYLFGRLAGAAPAAAPARDLDLTNLVETALRDLAVAYENRSVRGYMGLVDRTYHSTVTNARDYAQLEAALREDFRNFSSIRLWLNLRGRPAYYPERALIEAGVNWSRRMTLRASGQEWDLRNQNTRFIFSIDGDGRLRLVSVESGEALFGLADHNGAVTITAGTIDGEPVIGTVTLEDGRIVSTSTGTGASSSTVTSGSVRGQVIADGAGWWTYTFMAPGYFTNAGIATREASFNLKSPGDGTCVIAGYKALPGGVQLLGAGSIDAPAYSTVPTGGYDAGEVASVSGRVYAVKTLNGRYAKIKIIDWAIGAGNISVDFDWQYQNDGTPNF